MHVHYPRAKSMISQLGSAAAQLLHNDKHRSCFASLAGAAVAAASCQKLELDNDFASSGQSDARPQGFLSASVSHQIGKTRLDAWIAEQLPRASRARVQSSIKEGLAKVNGKPITKVSYVVKEGDLVECHLRGPVPMEAKPQDIDLDIVYEDDHLIVINKPAAMVVHPAPGNEDGTLVNALLHHCSLPTVQCSIPSLDNISANISADCEDCDDDDDDDVSLKFSGPAPVIRPGIVHRLDKGTSGLLVVAKDEYSHMILSEQFKSRTAKRTYVSLTCGSPTSMAGRIEMPIVRDPNDRKRMAVGGSGSSFSRARYAASRYRVLEVLAQGGSALVKWKLETGRTHQIRVHARYLGFPILGDEVYGGTEGLAISRLFPCASATSHSTIRRLVGGIQHPCLHAYTLGFVHPWTKTEHEFSCPPPPDFEHVWQTLRTLD